MKTVPSIEVGVDTVYVRSNIIAIDKGWEYDEIQYDKNEYIELMTAKQIALEEKINASAIATNYILMNP